MKKKIIATAVTGAVVISSIVGVSAMSNSDKPKTVDKSVPATSQVETTTTTEQPDTSTQTTAPAAAAPKSTAPAVATPTGPVTVTGFREIVIDEQNSDCEYTYSDGSTYRFQWKSLDPKAVQMTKPDGSIQYIAANKYLGVCDDTAIGLPKS